MPPLLLDAGILVAFGSLQRHASDPKPIRASHSAGASKTEYVEAWHNEQVATSQVKYQETAIDGSAL